MDDGMNWSNNGLISSSTKPLTYPFNGLVQDCSNSSANALELLQSCTKPSIFIHN